MGKESSPNIEGYGLTNYTLHMNLVIVDRCYTVYVYINISNVKCTTEILIILALLLDCHLKSYTLNITKLRLTLLVNIAIKLCYLRNYF